MAPGSSPSRMQRDAGGTLSDSDLLALLRREEQASAGYQDSALSGQRKEALAYYDRQPFGIEEEGRSQVVTSEFADVIESIMPGLMRVFTGTDDLATFAPLAPGQEQWAREASAYVPHVLMRQNDGFRIVSALLKDALMYRLGGVSVDVETVDETITLPLEALPDDAVDLIVAEAEAQGTSAEIEDSDYMDDKGDQPSVAPEGSEGGRRAPGKLVLTHARRRVVVESIAPEDIRFSPAAREEDKASYLGFIKRASSSDLVRLGLTTDEIDDLRSEQRPALGRGGATHRRRRGGRCPVRRRRQRAADPAGRGLCPRRRRRRRHLRVHARRLRPRRRHRRTDHRTHPMGGTGFHRAGHANPVLTSSSAGRCSTRPRTCSSWARC